MRDLEIESVETLNAIRDWRYFTTNTTILNMFREDLTNTAGNFIKRLMKKHDHMISVSHQQLLAQQQQLHLTVMNQLQKANTDLISPYDLGDELLEFQRLLKTKTEKEMKKIQNRSLANTANSTTSIKR